VEPESESIKDGIQKALEEDKEVKYKDRDWKNMAEETIKLYKKSA
jgi:hypothetical protein